MTYLTNVLIIILHNPCLVTVALGGMLVNLCFLRPRWKWWLFPVLLALTFLAMPAMYLLLTTVLDKSNSYGIIMACLGYWNDIMVIIAFRERFGAIITLVFTQAILNRLSTFCGYILHITLHSVIGYNLDIAFSIELILVVMYLAILLVSWLFLREKGRKLIQSDLHRHNWMALAGIATTARLAIDLCSDYAFDLDPYSHIKIIWAMISLCVFALSVLTLYLYGTITALKHSKLKAAADRLIFEKEAQQRYYETQLHNQEELRILKHDMTGHLNTLSRLLAEDNKDEAVRYLNSLADYTSSHQKKLYSSDPYLNAVITNYASVFAENNIPFDHDIQLDRIELHHIEMCTALNNALQNALEASLKLSVEQRYVRLKIKRKQDHFLFRVTNRFDCKLIIEDGLPRSTKEEEGHGYGLRSICDAAESLGGFAVCKNEGDMFVLDVAL